MTTEAMKEKVLGYIRQNNQVSYAELEWFFEQNGFDYKGNLDLLSGQCDHIVFWIGWNQEAYIILSELISEGLIHREPANPLVYLLDGKKLRLPIMKKAVEYKTDHWLPTVFCPGKENQGVQGHPFT